VVARLLRLWRRRRATVILEHGLFVAKSFLASILPEDVADAKLAWQVAEDAKKKQLKNWNIEENEIEDPTPF
jgi:hypothetical protein